MRILKEATVEIIQKCNSNCIFCSSISDSTSNKQVPLKKLFEISDFCYSKGLRTMNISGGEPFLYKNLTDYLLYNREIGLNSVIYTSGNIYSMDVIEKLLKDLKDTKDVKIIFNYPTLDKKTFQMLVNSNEFEPQKIDTIITHLIKNGMDIETHIIPNELNIEQLFDTVMHLRNIGVKRVSLLRLVLQGRAKLNADYLQIKNAEYLKQVASEIKKHLVTDNFSVRFGIPFSNYSNIECKCFAGIGKLIFKYDGYVYPCEAYKEAPNNELFVLGNIYKDELEKIWKNHPVHARLIKLKEKALEKHEPCPAQLLYQ